MKKLFFLAVLASLCIYFGCNKADQQEGIQANPATDVSGNTIGNENDKVTTRANCGLECSCTCCCGLTLVAPTNTNIDIEICVVALGCFGTGGYACTVGGGNGNCGTGVAGTAGATTLNTGSNPTKIFCSGATTDNLRVTNLSAVPARFVIECGGSSSNQFVLQPGESALIRKGTNCDIDPADPCIYL